MAFVRAVPGPVQVLFQGHPGELVGLPGRLGWGHRFDLSNRNKALSPSIWAVRGMPHNRTLSAHHFHILATPTAPARRRLASLQANVSGGFSLTSNEYATCAGGFPVRNVN